MDRKKLLQFVLGISVVFVVIFVMVSFLSKSAKVAEIQKSQYDDFKNMALEDQMSFLQNSISDVNTNSPRKASIDLAPTSLYDELPSIDKYPLQITGNGDINIEIFSSPEKSTKDTETLKTDDWLLNVADNFNSQGFQIDGRTISVSIRNVSSGQAADYIISGKYMPDAYTPSSYLWGNLINAQGGNVKIASDRLVGNIAGILVSKETKQKLVTEYGAADIKSIIQAVVKNEIIMGYTNPLASSTGLNFLMCTLNYYDQSDPLSDKAKAGFTSFQNNIPYVAYTTMQMNTSATTGKLDSLILEYQSYINNPALADYEFIPFGIRHDNPIYSVGELSSEKQAVLDKFIEYAQNDDSQKIASDNGFNAFNDYKGNQYIDDGNVLLEAQKLWKDNKDGGKDIIAVFVADVSGSMGDNDAIYQLQKSLINGAQYIRDNNYIGLVSYSNKVTIELPIGKFDLNQRAYFQGAVEDLRAGGQTATYDGVTIGLQMLMDAKKDHPDAKLMLFLLSDGNQNTGNPYDYVAEAVKNSQIPIYTIGYNANIDELKLISDINEGSSINADSDDVIYKIKSLFNAQM